MSVLTISIACFYFIIKGPVFDYFNVKKIIRIGTCGVVDESVKIPELILADNIYSESNFAYSFNDYKEHTVKPTQELNETIINTSKELSMNIHVGTMVTADVFGPYVGMDRLLNRMPEDIHPLGEEMEGFALCHIANSMGIEASVIATAVDSKFSNVVLTPEERQTSLNDMITLALESIIK